MCLNQHRFFFKDCLSITLGIGAAFSGKVPPEWFQAIMADKDKAEDVSNKVRQARESKGDKAVRRAVEPLF